MVKSSCWIYFLTLFLSFYLSKMFTTCSQNFFWSIILLGNHMLILGEFNIFTRDMKLFSRCVSVLFLFFRVSYTCLLWNHMLICEELCVNLSKIQHIYQETETLHAIFVLPYTSLLSNHVLNFEKFNLLTRNNQVYRKFWKKKISGKSFSCLIRNLIPQY